MCVLLPLLTNPSEVQQVNEEGLAYVADRIRYYTAMESIMLPGRDESALPQAENLRDHILELYKAIIDYEVQYTFRFFRRWFGNLVRDVVKWDPWEKMLKAVKELGARVENESMHINSSLSRKALNGIARGLEVQNERDCLRVFRQERGDYVGLKDVVAERVRDTGLWVLNHDSYQAWLKAKAGPLLITANPGCGKPVLAKFLADSRFEFQFPREVAICYFFFRDGYQRTASAALYAVLHQLFCLKPQMISHALPIFDQEGSTLPENFTGLCGILEAVADDEKAGTIVIVLDGLDECQQDKRNFDNFARFIEAHFSNGRGRLKTFLTSRPYERMMQRFKHLETAHSHIRIRGEDDCKNIRHEIDNVIEYCVTQLSGAGIDNALRLHLRERLMGIPHRTYLWLHLVFDELQNPCIKQSA